MSVEANLKDMSFKKAAKIATGIVGGIIALDMALTGFFITGSDENSVVKTLGVVSRVADNGMHVKYPWPISTVTHYGTGVQNAVVEETRPPCGSTDSRNADNKGGSTYTKDQQIVYASSAVQFALKPGGDLETIQNKFGGSSYKSFTDRFVAQAQKEILGAYDTKDVPANRLKIAGEIAKAFERQVKDEKMPVAVVGAQLTNLDFSCSYEAGVEKAASAKTEKTRLETERDTERVKKDKAVITAEGLRDSAIATAEGTKRAAELAAEGNAAGAKSMIAAFGGLDNYFKYLDKQAQLLWKGEVPYAVSGNGGGSNIVIPLPQPPTRPAAANDAQPQKHTP